MAPALSPAKLESLRKALPPGLAGGLFRASEFSGRPARRRSGAFLPTRVGALDRLLGGGLPRGRLVELTGPRSSGRLATGISTLAAATQCGESAALADLGDGFDPRQALAAGTDLTRLLWIRPRRLRDAVACAEVALAAGFALVVVDLGMPPLPGGRLPGAAWVRLGRAALAQDAALLLLSPYPVSGACAHAVVAIRRSQPRWLGSGRSPRLLAGVSARFVLERCRGSSPGREEAARFRAPDALPVDDERIAETSSNGRLAAGAATGTGCF